MGLHRYPRRRPERIGLGDEVGDDRRPLPEDAHSALPCELVALDAPLRSASRLCTHPDLRRIPSSYFSRFLSQSSPQGSYRIPPKRAATTRPLEAFPSKTRYPFRVLEGDRKIIYDFRLAPITLLQDGEEIFALEYLVARFALLRLNIGFVGAGHVPGLQEYGEESFRPGDAAEHSLMVSGERVPMLSGVHLALDEG